MSEVAILPQENRPDDSNAYETPQWLFNALEAEFGRFDIDAFASEKNSKCLYHFSQDLCALQNPWTWHTFGIDPQEMGRGPRVFANPPYSANMLGKSVTAMARNAVQYDCTVVGLFPPNTDTSWWHEVVMRTASEVRLCQGRIGFEFERAPITVWNPKTKRLEEGSNRGASAIVVFRPHVFGPPILRSMSAK